MSTNSINTDRLFLALERSLAMIVFDVDGRILWANQPFANTIGYGIEELQGMHHRQLCLSEFTNSPDYEGFWRNLRQNKAYHDKVKRVYKTGNVIFLDAIYTPVLNENGKVERVIKIAIDITDREMMLKNSADEFMDLVNEMTTYTDKVHRAFQQVITEMTQLKEEAETIEHSLKQIETISTSVKDVATRSNILGLNANIEAARAGDAGKGFAVVANEIRNMANESRDSAEHISEQLNQIKTYVTSMSEMVDLVADNVHGNSDAIRELRNAYQQVSATAEKLSSVGDQIH